MKSETFKIIFKKLKDGYIRKNSKEYERLVDNLCKISGLTVEETEICIE